MSSPAFVVMSRRSLGLCSEHCKIFRKIRRDWQPIAILTPAPGMAPQRTFPVGCVGLRAKNFRSSRSIARIWGVRCAGSKSPLCLCVPATAACIMKMALALPAHHRAGSMSTNTRLSRQNCGCAAGSCRLYRNRFEAGQVAEKDSYASFHSTDSLQFVFVVRGRARADFTVTFHGHDHEDCVPWLRFLSSLVGRKKRNLAC